MRNWSLAGFVWRPKTACWCFLECLRICHFCVLRPLNISLLPLHRLRARGGGFPRYRFETQGLSSDLYSLKQAKLEFLQRGGTSEIALPYTLAGKYECEVTANPDSHSETWLYFYPTTRSHILEGSLYLKIISMLYSHLFVRLRSRLSLSSLFPFTILHAFYLYRDVLYIPLILFSLIQPFQ